MKPLVFSIVVLTAITTVIKADNQEANVGSLDYQSKSFDNDGGKSLDYHSQTFDNSFTGQETKNKNLEVLGSFEEFVKKYGTPTTKPFSVDIPFPYKLHAKVKVRVPDDTRYAKHVLMPVFVDKPVPVKILVDQPIPVEKRVPQYYTVEIAKPYPVKKYVPFPVEVTVPVDKPYPVYKDIPVPVHVFVDQPVPKFVDRPYPVRVYRNKEQVDYREEAGVDTEHQDYVHRNALDDTSKKTETLIINTPDSSREAM